MYHTQIVVRQQHRIFLGVSIVGIDFRMAVKVHALGRESQVHGLFVQSVGAGGIHLVVQCQFNDFPHALKRRAPAHRGHFSVFKPRQVHKVQMVNVDDPQVKAACSTLSTRCTVSSGWPSSTAAFFDNVCIPHDKRPAFLIDRFVEQGLHTQLRPVARGSPIVMPMTGRLISVLFMGQCIPFSAFSRSTCRSAATPSSGSWLNGARHFPTS